MLSQFGNIHEQLETAQARNRELLAENAELKRLLDEQDAEITEQGERLGKIIKWAVIVKDDRRTRVWVQDTMIDIIQLAEGKE